MSQYCPTCQRLLPPYAKPREHLVVILPGIRYDPSLVMEKLAELQQMPCWQAQMLMADRDFDD